MSRDGPPRAGSRRAGGRRRRRRFGGSHEAWRAVSAGASVRAFSAFDYGTRRVGVAVGNTLLRRRNR